MSKPLVIRRGVGAATVYHVGPRVWEVRAHPEGRGGKVYRRKFNDRVAARLNAEEVATCIANGSTELLRTTPIERNAWSQAREIAREIGRPILDLMYEAKQRWQLATAQRLAAAPTVTAVLAEFLAEKTRQQLSKYHLRDLKARLTPFAKAFQVEINRLGRAEIEEWLRGLKVGARTWNNYRAAVAALCKFAKERKYLPGDWNELAGLDGIKLKRGTITIFTPAQMTALLSASSERLLPALVLGAFAGLRSEEIQRLKWVDVKWDKGVIHLREDITKTNRVRQVPIADNLADWLAPWQESSGKVCDYVNLSVGKCNLARRLGLKWSRNILRHSFISYRVAQTHDLARVALEAGNSPGVIQRHYLELTSPAEAGKWFEIRPKTVTQNVLPLQFR